MVSDVTTEKSEVPKINEKKYHRKTGFLLVKSLRPYITAVAILWILVFVVSWKLTEYQAYLFHVGDKETVPDWLQNAQAIGEASGFPAAVISGFAFVAVIVTFVWQFRENHRNQEDLGKAMEKLEAAATLLKSVVEALSHDSKLESIAIHIRVLSDLIREGQSTPSMANQVGGWKKERERLLKELVEVKDRPATRELVDA